jgi:hypothetical protein
MHTFFVWNVIESQTTLKHYHVHLNFILEIYKIYIWGEHFLLIVMNFDFLINFVV